MSVEDNIMAVLEMTKLSHAEQVEKLESLINEFRLNKVRKNKGDQLSGGERRRTEIARCLAINPKFIMLDEPFAGVDPIAVEDSVALEISKHRHPHYGSQRARNAFYHRSRLSLVRRTHPFPWHFRGIGCQSHCAQELFER